MRGGLRERSLVPVRCVPPTRIRCPRGTFQYSAHCFVFEAIGRGSMRVRSSLRPLTHQLPVLNFPRDCRAERPETSRGAIKMEENSGSDESCAMKYAHRSRWPCLATLQQASKRANALHFDCVRVLASHTQNHTHTHTHTHTC